MLSRRSMIAAGLAATVFNRRALAETRKATLRLDWSIGGWQAPFILALDRGFYAEAGIDLDILEGRGSLTTVQLVGRGNDTFGYVDASVLPKAVSAGFPVKMVMGIIKRSLMSIVVRSDDPSMKPKDLVGKTFTVTAGDAQSALLPAYLDANGMKPSDIKLMAVDPGAKYKLVVEGQADGVVTFGVIGIPLLETLSPAAPLHLRKLDFSESGINIPSFGLIANETTVTKDPDLVRRFVAASARGWEAARENPQSAIEAALKRYPQVKSREKEFQNTLKFLFDYVDTPRTIGKPFGWMSPEDWKDAEVLMTKYMGLKAQGSIGAYYTNDFIR